TYEGRVTVKWNMNIAPDTTYAVFVSIDNFNIGKILNQDSGLSILSAQAQVKGRRLNPKKMQADIKGKINHRDAMGYAYKDISLDVQAQDADIGGSLISPDPNVQFNLDFAADMRGQYPKVHAEMMIDSINLQKLKLMDDN